MPEPLAQRNWQQQWQWQAAAQEQQWQWQWQQPQQQPPSGEPLSANQEDAEAPAAEEAAAARGRRRLWKDVGRPAADSKRALKAARASRDQATSWSEMLTLMWPGSMAKTFPPKGEEWDWEALNQFAEDHGIELSFHLRGVRHKPAQERWLKSQNLASVGSFVGNRGYRLSLIGPRAAATVVALKCIETCEARGLCMTQARENPRLMGRQRAEEAGSDSENEEEEPSEAEEEQAEEGEEMRASREGGEGGRGGIAESAAESPAESGKAGEETTGESGGEGGEESGATAEEEREKPAQKSSGGGGAAAKSPMDESRAAESVSSSGSHAEPHEDMDVDVDFGSDNDVDEGVPEAGQIPNPELRKRRFLEACKRSLAAAASLPSAAAGDTAAQLRATLSQVEANVNALAGSLRFEETESSAGDVLVCCVHCLHRSDQVKKALPLQALALLPLRGVCCIRLTIFGDHQDADDLEEWVRHEMAWARDLLAAG